MLTSVQEKRKHAPVASKGTVFLRANNAGLNEKIFKKGKAEPERLRFSIRDNDGKVHKYRYRGDLAVDWNDPAFIKALNKWFKQVISRTLDKGDQVVKDPRQPWSLIEKKALEKILKSYIRRTSVKTKLTTADWAAVTRKFNNKIRGRTLAVGEILPPYKKKAEMTTGGTNKKERVLGDRNETGLKSQVSRWDTQEKVDRWIAKNDTTSGGPPSHEDADEADEEGETSSEVESS